MKGRINEAVVRGKDNAVMLSGESEALMDSTKAILKGLESGWLGRSSSAVAQRLHYPQYAEILLDSLRSRIIDGQSFFIWFEDEVL